MWNTVFYHPIVNLLLLMYKLVGENLGLAIIAIVVILRVVLWPLTAMQMKSQKKLQQMQPKLKKFQGKDASKMTMSEMGAVKDVFKGCAFGCLPTLIQLPFLIALYNALRILATSGGTVFNDVAYSAFLTFPEGYSFNTLFLGLDLAIIPSQLGFQTFEVLPYLGLALLVAVSQWATTKLMTPPKTEEQKKKEAAAKATAELVKGLKEKGFTKKAEQVEKKAAEDNPQEMMSSMSGSFTIFLPIMIAVASFSVPAALGIYWFVQSLLLAVQTGLPKGISWIKANSGKEEGLGAIAWNQIKGEGQKRYQKIRGLVVKEGKVEPVDEKEKVKSEGSSADAKKRESRKHGRKRRK